ncbi:MAG: hypothetical protein KDB01_13045 [Planctomycetaceae bacterium]|nr:hypothetical protein [Planctomycetaceae bacterium]
MQKSEKQSRQEKLGWTKAEIDKCWSPAESPPRLASGSIPRDGFQLVATCSPEFVIEYLETPDLVPVNVDQYSTMDALIAFIAVMSMRYGLYCPETVRRVCTFLRRYTLDELNAELQAGRSFVLVPTYKEPRFTDEDLILVNLRQICGDHIYPGFLLDVAAAVATVNARIRREGGAA